MSDQLNHNDIIEQRLWEYIDGEGSANERSEIEKLIASQVEWKAKYGELLEVHKLISSTELEEPSMRFTRNVMEEIAKYHIAPATKTYINNRIVKGIGAFFIVMIIGFIIYGFAQIDWTAENSTTGKYIDITRVDYSKMFNNTYMNILMMLNVVLGLFLLDRYFANKRKEYQHEA